MKRIYDSELLNQYVDKYNINEFFSADLKAHMELIYFKRNEYICKENEKINYQP